MATRRFQCKTIPTEPWDFNVKPPTPYQMELKKALKEYHENIPDPKEWSQEYPWFCSSTWTNTLAWNKDKTTPMDLDSSQQMGRKTL